VTPPVRTARPGAGADPCADTDRDVSAAVDRALRDTCRDRRGEALAVDAVFAEHMVRALAEFALAGGSRRRAALLWWGWRACGGHRGDESPRAVLDVAAALELIQCCALVHDDVMDGSALRRGRPAVHVDLTHRYGGGQSRGARGAAPFGWSAAVLVGDLALVWADDLVAGAALSAPGRGRLLPLWRMMRVEMVAGQYLDLNSYGSAPCSPARALRTAFLKSALYSVERPLALGAALAGAGHATRRALRDAGRCAGLAFQLRDDLLGAFGDPLVTGKPSGDDLRQGKATYLVAIARKRAREDGDTAALRVLDRALGDRSLSAAGLDRVRDVLMATGARAAVEKRIDRLADHCATRLRGARLAPAPLAELLAVLDTAAGRRAEAGRGAEAGRQAEAGRRAETGRRAGGGCGGPSCGP
jgi:geranylgeranyl diphosphate synthase type I